MTGKQFIENPIIKMIMSSLITLFFGSIVVLAGFYYNGSNAMANNASNTKELERDVKLLNDKIDKISTIPLVNQSQISNMKENIKKVEISINKIHENIESVDESVDEIKILLIKMDAENRHH